MVEPFTAVIFNTLLSPRSTLLCPASFTSIARVSSLRNPISPNFFSPQPRDTKGKNKVNATSNDSYHLSECQAWSSCISHHALWCPHQICSMLTELTQGRKEPSRCHKRHPPLSRRGLLPKYCSPLFVNQRRHSSQSSNDSHPPDSPPPDEPTSNTPPPALDSLTTEEIHRRLEKILRTPRRDINMYTSWVTYKAAERHPIPTRTKLAFADKFISTAEMYHVHWTTQQKFATWSRRAHEILLPLISEIEPQTRLDQWRLCLLTRALALSGDVEKAISTLHEADSVPLPYALKAGIPYAYEMVMRSIAYFSDNTSVIDFTAKEWKAIVSYIQHPLDQPPPVERASRSMRKFLFQVVLEVSNPKPFLARKSESREWHEAIGCLFIKAFSLARRGREAYDVFLKMQELGLHVPQPFQYSLIKALAHQTFTMQHATELMASLPPGDRRSVSYLQLALYVAARQGNPEAAERYYDDISKQRQPTPDDTQSLIQSYAVRGDPLQVEAAFNRFFPLDLDGKRMHSPGLFHYAPVIHAHAKRGDQAGITRWLTELSSVGLVPDEHISTIVLDAFAHSGDAVSVKAILKQMREAGMKPTAATYTIAITMLAHRRDPLGAETMFKRAVREGVVPDNRMINAIMNAHAETGSWKGVIRTYDYLVASGTRMLNADSYNTLMKAYVLIGAPFSVVSNFFKRLLKTGVKPTAYTYALLIQSACDAGQMEIATDIYYDMEELHLEEPDRGLEMNVYIMTILLAGFLRHGDKIKAKQVYEEMGNKGIRPTPITFATIIKSYANERSTENLRIAEEFIQAQAVNFEELNQLKPKYDSKLAVHHLYGPVISAYAKMDKPEDTERVYQEMIDQGAPPSLGTLSALLDLYRRQLNIDAVLAIWPKIYVLGMALTDDRPSTENKASKGVTGPRGTILSVPLSIYIDALSSAGRHTDIAAVWTEFRNNGFVFDSHNWNHLVVALVRAGQPERAYEVIERIIIPFQELATSTPVDRLRDQNPSSPLISDVSVPNNPDVIEETPGEPPLHRDGKRMLASRIAEERIARTEGWDPEGQDDDLAHHLYILHKISPSWATWKPHNATLTMLLVAYNRLTAGMLVKPFQSDGPGSLEPEEDEQPQAWEILTRIREKYPKAVNAVLSFDLRERQRLGEHYDERYKWG